MTKPKNLYALFVGINKYESVTGLNGCINDVNAMRAYLQAQPDILLKERVLISDENHHDFPKPTKSAIVAAIKEHLGQAEKDDMVLFYFAGHGVQERTAIPAFVKAEPGGLIESLVCYDSKLNVANSADHTCLADKELRWLFHDIAQKSPHILILTDCCHSGDVMRDALEDDSSKKRKGSDKVLPPRAFEGFVFHQHISAHALATQSLNDLIPLGNYIHFAACRNTEVAWEGDYERDKPGGLFTISLLKILQKGGRNLSYHALNSRLVNYMRGWKNKAQRPQVFAGSDQMGALYGLFLNGEIAKTTSRASITGNDKYGWTLDLGAIHGIVPGDKKTPVKVFNSTGHEPIGEVMIEKIYPGFCTLNNSSGLLEKDQLVYFATINCFAATPPTVFLKGPDTGGLELFRKLVGENLWEAKSLSVEIVENEAEADYVLHAENSEYRITKSYDTRPLVQQVYGYETAQAKLVRDYFLHIARWKFVRELNNPDTKLNKKQGIQKSNYPIKMQLFVLDPDGNERESDIREVNTLEMNVPNEEGELFGKFRIKLTNVGSENLYCSLLYMPMTFGIYNTLLPGGGIWLDPGDEIWAVEGEYIALSVDGYIYDFDWDGSSEYLKLIVSATEFSTEELTLEELPLPEITRSKVSRGAFHYSPPKSGVKEDDWMAVGYEMFIKNPRAFVQKNHSA
ncbi:MAG: caspase family protein [Bacteroidia bacterium]